MDPTWIAFMISIVYALGLILAKMIDSHIRFKARFNTEYVQYESPEFLDKKWIATNSLGIVCRVCGMDDAVIVFNRHCKFCIELEKLNDHLVANGIRRFRKAA